MAKRSAKTGKKKHHAARRKDLGLDASTSHAVTGGAFNGFQPTTQFPTETIRPGNAMRPASLSTRAGGEVISSDAY
jgi:hypothetical protein